MKKIFSLLILFVLSPNIYAQAPDWLWAKNAIGVNYNSGSSVETDQAGNVYVAGSFSGDSIRFNNISLNVNNGDTDASIFVAKYDSIGNIIWAKAFSGNRNEGASLTIDKNANIYIAGAFYSDSIKFGNFTLYNAGINGFAHDCDLFIAQLDTNGNVNWAISAGTDGFDQACAITTDQNNNIYVTGSFEDTLIFNNIVLINNDATAGATLGSVLNEFVIKLDEFGNVIWGKNKLADRGYAVACDKNQNVYVTGQNSSANTMFPLMYIEKFDALGNLLWTNMIDGYSYAWALDVDDHGNAYVSGEFHNTLHLGNYTFVPNSTFLNSYLVKYKPNGNVIWAKTIGEYSSNSTIDVKVENYEHFYLTGLFGGDSISIDGNVLHNSNPNLYGNDIYVLKCDTMGNVLWAKSAGGVGSDGVSSITANQKGNAFITGYYFSDSCDFGNTVFTDSGFNFYVAKIDASTALSLPANKSENITFSIIPNPNHGQFIFHFEGDWIQTSKSYQLIVQNMLGKDLYSFQLSSNNSTIDLSQLSNGVYLISLNDGKNKLNKRLVIAK